MALLAAVSEIMPDGKPDFSIIPFAPTIKDLVRDAGYEGIATAIYMLVKNYCQSQNLPEGKNMTKDQMKEAAAFLIDEAGNYRFEDYVMMFTLAKRGKLTKERNRAITGRVFDRVDITLISEFKANYDDMREDYAHSAREDEVRRKEEGAGKPDMLAIDEPEEVKQKRWADAVKMFNDFKEKWDIEQAERKAKELEIWDQKVARWQEFKKNNPDRFYQQNDSP